MLHLEIQKGKEAINMSKFQKDLGGTTVYTKRLDIATKECGQLTSNYTYFAENWFSYVKTYEEIAAAGVNYFGPTKMTHKGSCLNTLEKLMKD